ncbi:hypothetical protein EXS62_02165 [Candidatus Kaiserbacteria bacterium]|nr:hypothetical protein [Candidatus Kaiserbacteria bacterium]
MFQANIVQAEFFHVDVRAASLNSMLSEVSERKADGSPIKTTVRFYDTHGFVTDFVSRAGVLRRQRIETAAAFAQAGFVRRWFLDRKSRRLAGKILEAKRYAKDLAAERVDKVINTGGKIAVECPDRSFRWARGEELYELCLATGKATGVLLFLFQPNDLLADKDSPVGCFM